MTSIKLGVHLPVAGPGASPGATRRRACMTPPAETGMRVSMTRILSDCPLSAEVPPACQVTRLSDHSITPAATVAPATDSRCSTTKSPPSTRPTRAGHDADSA